VAPSSLVSEWTTFEVARLLITETLLLSGITLPKSWLFVAAVTGPRKFCCARGLVCADICCGVFSLGHAPAKCVPRHSGRWGDRTHG
jgi:hypothetical protein